MLPMSRTLVPWHLFHDLCDSNVVRRVDFRDMFCVAERMNACATALLHSDKESAY